MKSPRASSFRRWLVAGLGLALLLPVAYYVARREVWPAYKSWREARLAKLARQFMAAHDYDNALLTARQALRTDQRDLASWRLAEAAAKAKDSPDVVYYAQNVARLEKSLPSQLDFIRVALAHGYYWNAIDVIKGLDASARRNAEFHELAAQAYLRAGQPLVAQLHLYSLIELRPDDRTAQLDLAEIKLAQDPGRRDRALRDQVAALAREPALRARALTLLLKDALGAGAAGASDAARLAAELRATTGLTDAQRVLALSGLLLGAPDQAGPYRHELERDFAAKPAGAVALIGCYAGAGEPAEARRWFESLPPKVQSDPAVAEAMAAPLVALRDWTRLDRLLAAGSWKGREFMRDAYLAYSARTNGRPAEASNAWKLAVLQAGDDAGSTSELIRLVSSWGWSGEQYDLVWKLFALMPRNEAISRQLIAWERSQGHTANLNRLFARLAEVEPEDRMVKNNFAYLSLLLNANLTRAAQFARENHQAEPDNPYFTATAALALYRQGRPAQALALLRTAGPAALSTPERTTLLALFSAATGDTRTAADALAGVNGAVLLPEERQLLVRTGTLLAQARHERGEDARLAALSRDGAIDPAKGWLQALSAPARSAATPEMKAAEELFATGDFTTLADQLRRAAWSGRDHLRFALLAFAARQRGDADGARLYWRSALGAAADRRDRLAELDALAGRWSWRAERMDAATRLFEAAPSDPATLRELVAYYREAGRTADLVAVLRAYVGAHPGDQAQRCDYAYYSMLSGLNVAQACLTAKQAYEAAPDPATGLVYAFALWKQHQAGEAWRLLDATGPGAAPVPRPLLKAAVLSDLNRGGEAAAALAEFDPAKALPEETALADGLRLRLAGDERVSRL